MLRCTHGYPLAQGPLLFNLIYSKFLDNPVGAGRPEPPFRLRCNVRKQQDVPGVLGAEQGNISPLLLGNDLRSLPVGAKDSSLFRRNGHGRCSPWSSRYWSRLPARSICEEAGSWGNGARACVSDFNAYQLETTATRAAGINPHLATLVN